MATQEPDVNNLNKLKLTTKFSIREETPHTLTILDVPVERSNI
jgi:hypothetical protein